MRLSSISFLLGVCAVLFFPVLPGLGSVVVLCVLSLALTLLYRVFLPVFFLIVGLLWVILSVHCYDQSVEVSRYQYKVVNVVGVVSSIPKIENKVEKFHFNVKEVNGRPSRLTITLAWYDEFQKVRVGEKWLFHVKFKKPRGFANPGGIDLEKISVATHIDATGYVAKNKRATLLGKTQHYPVSRLRERVNDYLKVRLDGMRHGSIIRALTVGFRDDIAQSDWRLFRLTGTSHLMSISGLHVGLISAAAFYLLTWSLKLSLFLCVRVPVSRIATIGTIMVAMMYIALTGFGIPEQRALVMLSVFLLAFGWGVNLSKWTAYCLSLWIVLLINPLSVMLPGFWLSFIAVALMILVLDVKKTNVLIKWLRVQWSLTLGLLPACLLFFGQVSLISPIVNLVAVPCVGFVVVPLSLLGAISSVLFPVFSSHIFELTDSVLEALWVALRYFANIPYASVFISVAQWWVFGVLIVSSLGALLAKRLWHKVVFFLGFSVLLIPVSSVSTGKVGFSLLDVGQGLSAVVRTAHHVLIFDTGPYFGGSFNAGDAVLIPFLRYYNIRSVDRVVLSHGHVDHTGGAQSLFHSFPVNQVLTSIPHYRANAQVNQCYAGQHWVWDEVAFEVLYPPKPLQYVVNNSSCVLRVRSKDKTFLFTGDIEKEAENYLVKHAKTLRADVLIAPHHGSHTSSSKKFLQAVSPSIVLFSTGYRNHYHFPHPSVVKRYEAMGVLAFNTADAGEIDISEGVSLYRNAHQHWWS